MYLHVVSTSYSTKLVLSGVMCSHEGHHHLRSFQPGNQDLSLTGSPPAMATPSPSKLRQYYLPDNSWISPFFSVLCITFSWAAINQFSLWWKQEQTFTHSHPPRPSPVYSPALAHHGPAGKGPAWRGLCPLIQAQLSQCHQATLATV